MITMLVPKISALLLEDATTRRSLVRIPMLVLWMIVVKILDALITLFLVTTTMNVPMIAAIKLLGVNMLM
jgi:hypothetical protein